MIWEDEADARCALANGRWCEGTAIHTCQGGRYQASSDCGADGAACQEDGDFAFCVDPQCPEGDGLRVYACVDATQIAGCNDGEYGVGDCAWFGLVCGSDAEGAACMDARCSAGPHSSFCLSDTTVAACADGVYAESACADGATCTDGVCAAPGGDTGACGSPGGDTAATPDGADSDDPSDPPGRLVPLDALGCSTGCATGSRGTVGLFAIAGVAFGLVRVPRRRDGRPRRANAAGGDQRAGVP